MADVEEDERPGEGGDGGVTEIVFSGGAAVPPLRLAAEGGGAPRGD